MRVTLQGLPPLFPYVVACSIESVIFNAVLCALLHAGIPLHRSFVSVTVALCGGDWVIDPLESEQVRHSTGIILRPMNAACCRRCPIACNPLTNTSRAGEQQLQRHARR